MLRLKNYQGGSVSWISDNWGSLASAAVGLVGSLSGLGFAIYQIMRTRAVATAARDAAQEVREALARNFTIVDLTRAGEQIQGLKEYHRTQ